MAALVGLRKLLDAGMLASTSPARRLLTTSPSGAFAGEPAKTRFGLVGVAVATAAGIALGSTISQSMASFLEENDLFVPSDDDDD